MGRAIRTMVKKKRKLKKGVCIACRGRGKSTTDAKCVPCKGTGKKQPTEVRKWKNG